MQQHQAPKSLVRSLTLVRASVSGTHPIFFCRLVFLDEAALCIQPLGSHSAAVCQAQNIFNKMEGGEKGKEGAYSSIPIS